jgi:ribonucleotide reductase alpha subunit
MPEDATVEDVEQLHIDAWKMGIKAVAIYRDNCKVGQPLSTTKKDGRRGQRPDVCGGPTRSRRRELHARIAELETSRRRCSRPRRPRRRASACRVVAARTPSPSASRTARATSPSASTRTVVPARSS